LRDLNQAVYRFHPDVQTIAEESTSWPLVSRPVYSGGLGFGLKWDLGFMHDSLDYLHREPIHRKYHNASLRFARCTRSRRTSSCRSRTTKSCTAKAR